MANIHFWLTDVRFERLQPLLPNKPHGMPWSISGSNLSFPAVPAARNTLDTTSGRTNIEIASSACSVASRTAADCHSI